MNKGTKMKKTQEQLNLDVVNASREIDTKTGNQFRYDTCRMAMMFNLLQDKYGWDEESIRHFYPEQTIARAIHQGWKPTETLTKGRSV
jgi:hypothetical protein